MNFCGKFKRHFYSLQVVQPRGVDINLSLKVAGSSFGIVTEFLYKIYVVPETNSINLPAYILDKKDLLTVNDIAKDTNFSVAVFREFSFRPRYLGFDCFSILVSAI